MMRDARSFTAGRFETSQEEVCWGYGTNISARTLTDFLLTCAA